MSAWAEGVISRLLTPGAIMVILGAVIALCSGKISQLAGKGSSDRKDLMIKAAGCILAAAGMILVFMP